uniref:Uncharacterized protein n=1 Tax=Acrobeloides nanus TaxID=290746 RepID=A0A914DN10_9BILA
MTSKVQLDRDVISRICKHNLAQRLLNSSDDDDENSDDTDGSKGRLDISNLKLGLVSKKCLLALKTACDEEYKGAKLSFYDVLRFASTHDLDSNVFHEISEPVFWLLYELSICELEFGDGNDQRYLQVLRKIKGFGLKRIFFCMSSSDSNPDHRSEMLRIISESSGTLKELCRVPYIFLLRLPHTLKLEMLTTIGSIPMSETLFSDFLQLSAKEVVIKAKDCYLPSHLLKNINAQTLHVNASGSWAEVIEESSVEIQANPSIQEISIVLRNQPINPRDFADKIYDIKKIIESIQKGYPNLTLLEIEDIYDRKPTYSLPRKDFVQFFTKLFIKTEALLSELQDLFFSIKMKQVFEVDKWIFNWIDSVNEISSLRKDEWKDFEEVQDDPRAETGKEYLSLKKLIQFGEGKSLEVTFFITQRLY